MGPAIAIKRDEPVIKHGYKITMVRDASGEVVGAIIEGPRFPKAFYLPRNPGSTIRVRLPEGVLAYLRREGFKLEGAR
ncbi:MAG: hypothetical protein QXU97_03980 [Fervidicoccaceae archaeon]